MREPQARPARTPALSPQVCEPQGSRPPSRRRNVCIDERWRPAALGGGERPGLAGATLSYRVRGAGCAEGPVLPRPAPLAPPRSPRPLAPPSPQDLAQIVAQLVSEDVDKDVLFPGPPRSAESGSAFQGFLVRSAPFWRNVTLEAQASRSPPSQETTQPRLSAFGAFPVGPGEAACQVWAHGPCALPSAHQTVMTSPGMRKQAWEGVWLPSPQNTHP